ncbi:MAG: DUF5906 domain-containing protein [Phascolarctobacterium sp.]|uniref:DNA primase family protein n=1 Tax=Phascolarctobacterium sp. TaxID=2049039 RepID=UPI0026DD30A8|nr:DUF5906 domain-containing protein [Phascolarctobacterium sp.]MDO4921755.1 DUF5906 domain-containing protein [Phascolarctobacterium sp.]
MQNNIYNKLNQSDARTIKEFYSNGGLFSLYYKGTSLYERILPDDEMLKAMQYCYDSEVFQEKCPEICKIISAYITPAQSSKIMEIALQPPTTNIVTDSSDQSYYTSAHQGKDASTHIVFPQTFGTQKNSPQSPIETIVTNPLTKSYQSTTCQLNNPSIKNMQKSPKPNAAQLAEQFLHTKHVRIYLETIYILVSSYYIPFTENEFYRQLNKLFREEAEKVGTIKLYTEITNFIKCDDKYVISDDQYLAQSHLICFLDGYLNTDNMTFLPPNPHIFFRTYVNLSYFDVQKSFNTHIFDEYLNSITGNDQILQTRIIEMIGLCISNDMAAKVLFLLQGVGNSGKSTLISLISALFPENLVSAINIDDLGQQFSISEIFGKALNTSAEMGDAPLSTKTVRRLKELTGGDLLSADVKFKSCIKFRNTAKIIAATNNILLTEKCDPAFLKRILVIPFKYSVPDNGINYKLLEQLKSELPGITRKAIQAYIALRSRNYIFTGNYNLNEVYQKGYSIPTITPDYLKNFLDVRVVPGSDDDYIRIGLLFELYKSWLANNHFPAPPDSSSELSFGKALRKIYPSSNFKKQRIPNCQSPVSCLICYKVIE